MNGKRQRQHFGDRFSAADVRACHGKTNYPSRRNAAARARCLVAETKNPTWSCYKCPRCRRWHIGHSRRWL